MSVFSCHRSLYIQIVYWRVAVVVVGGNVLHHVIRDWNCPGGRSVRGYMSEGGKCPGEISYTHDDACDV